MLRRSIGGIFGRRLRIFLVLVFLAEIQDQVAEVIASFLAAVVNLATCISMSVTSF